MAGSSDVQPRRSAVTAPRAGISGALAVAAALAAGELLAAVLTSLPSPVRLVGAVVVLASPPALTDWAIDAFGTANVVVLQGGILVVAVGLGAVVGLVARRSLAAASAVMATFGALAALASLAAPEYGLASAAVPAGAAVLTGVVTLGWLENRAAGGEDAGPGQPVPRRTFVGACLVVGAVAAAGGGVARLLPAGGRAATFARESAEIPVPPDGLPPPPARASLAVEGVSPLLTPNDDFYVIDTTLRPPQVDPATWRLACTGLVERPFSLTYDELLDLATDEADVLLACVSNEVGGELAGTARWQGVRLDALLERAGVQRRGTQVVGRAVDGFTVGFPTAAARDGRDALVAVAMNGEPLPIRHGFPARLVVPGLYGYVSATKWLTEIELATDAFEAYWVPRGWAKDGPIKIASRIDVPATGRRVDAGTVAVAGVAWAPLSGVRAVEISVDEGPWTEARLAEELNEVTWRQWVYEWEATPGTHTLAVRATDRDGRVQTAEPRPPRPDGATGHHTVSVRAG